MQAKQIEEYLNQLPLAGKGWDVIDGNPLTGLGASIRKEFNFKNFKEALDFVNKIGELAEQENHHPDIFLAWGKVIAELSTHAIGGLSENDFILAAKIESL